MRLPSCENAAWANRPSVLAENGGGASRLISFEDSSRLYAHATQSHCESGDIFKNCSVREQKLSCAASVWSKSNAPSAKDQILISTIQPGEFLRDPQTARNLLSGEIKNSGRVESAHENVRSSRQGAQFLCNHPALPINSKRSTAERRENCSLRRRCVIADA